MIDNVPNIYKEIINVKEAYKLKIHIFIRRKENLFIINH